LKKDFRHIDTPFYYYDTALLKATLDAICAAIASQPNYYVHYAMKANANPKLMQLIREAGFGVDCVSGGEIRTAIAEGFEADSIMFAGVGKSDWEIRLALQLGIFSFNVESLAELEVIQELAEQEQRIARVCLRINPDVEAHTHTHIVTGMAENKFGIALDDMMMVIEKANQYANISLKGLHFHIGSQITDMQDFKDLCERINAIQDQLNAQGVYPEIINVGGGLGVDYYAPSENPIPDFKAYFSVFMDCLQLRDGQSLHFELGRSIVAQCGSLMTRVLYVKQSVDKQFAIVDAGMTELIRPALYGAYHHIENLTSTADKMQKYDVVGPICESSDIFAADFPLPTTQRGDILAIRSAGAYGESMASCYNCRQLPSSYTDKEIE
jgi:diaminopimelate decarboxylase